jgi:hypothetical protein
LRYPYPNAEYVVATLQPGVVSGTRPQS